MGFKIYKRDTIAFEVEGAEIEMVVQRLSAKYEMLIQNTISRLQEKHGEKFYATEDFAELYAGMLAEIIVEVRGIDDLPKWETKEQLKEILIQCGYDFLISGVSAYNQSKEVADPKK